MCGIFGYISTKDSISRPTVEAMGASISHRGPDDSGIFFGERCAIGNQRLSIIDVEGGKQPFFSEDKKIVVVQNGEIYNHVELAQELEAEGIYCHTRSDTEVILRLYETRGINFLHKLNGMFAIAIYDHNIDGVYLVRDRLGIKPLYIYDDGNTAIFSSEIKAILKNNVNHSINYDAIDYYLSLNYVPPPLTMYKYIKQLEPGFWQLIRRDKRQSQRWWSVMNAPAIEQQESDWVDEFNFIMDDAVKLRMRADVPFGAFLSGGVDSSTVVGKMSEHSSHAIQTYGVGFEEKAYDETPFIQMASDRFKTKHTQETVQSDLLEIWPFFIHHVDQPHGDVSFMPTYILSRLASSDVKVVLTGDGADELFAGYDKYHWLSNFDAEDSRQSGSFDSALLQSLTLFDSATKKELFSHSKHSSADEFILNIVKQSSKMDPINRALYLDTRLLLPGNNLVKPDRMGMAASIEARIPFLDYRLVEYSFRMPGNLKLRNGVSKYLYKKAVEGLIGKRLAYRKKQMFTVPVGDWFRNPDMYQHLVNLLPIDSTSDLVNPKVVRRMLDAHVEHRGNYTRELRALISLELWFKGHRQFIN